MSLLHLPPPSPSRLTSLRNSPAENPVSFSVITLNSLRVSSQRCRFNQSRLTLTPTASLTVDSHSPTTSSGRGRTEEGDSPRVLLEVRDLTAVIAESKAQILKGVNLVIREGEIHAIMGKNGSGKSTFSKVLVGHPDYEVTGGSVIFKGENLLDMDPEERSLSGLFMSFQSPIEIPGVSNMDFLNMAYNARMRKLGRKELGPIEFYEVISRKLDVVNMKIDFLNRNVNEGFSGGERKRNEILQLATYMEYEERNSS